MSTEDATNVTTPLPTWARVLVGVFIVGLIGITTLIGYGSYVAAEWQKNVRSPEKVRQVVQSIMEIDLPPEYEIVMGYDVLNTQVVQFSYKPDSTQFKFLKMYNQHKLTAQNLDANVTHDPTEPSDLRNASAPAIRKVAGQDMHYTIGTTNIGVDFQQMRGLMLLDNGNFLLRFSASTPGKKLNQEATDKLLAAIKSLR